MRLLPVIVISYGLMVSACTQSSAPFAGSPHLQTPQSIMTHVAKQVQKCWFKTKNPAFKKYKMAAELNSFSGQPRILLVPRHRPTGLPKLVAQAQRKGGVTHFTTFGPLIHSPKGPRLHASLNAWAQGQTTC